MILRAAWVCPVSSPPIADGFVQISQSAIVRVGRATELPSDAPVDDLGHVLLLPGLVNPHTHLELGCYAGKLAPAPFWAWLEQLIVLRREPGQIEREQRAATEAAWQSLRAGVTCVGDISRRNLTWSVLKSIPIRKVCFVELLTLADHPPRDPDELRAGVQEVVEDELLTVGISPHTPYTVPHEHVSAAVRMARELDRPWTMHLAETREEVAFLRDGAQAFPPLLASLMEQCGVVSPRLAPIEYLERYVGDAPAGALAHVNYIDAADLARLAKTRHVVVYCPRAHRFFGHAPHPLPRLRAAGVTVAIGTDSPASNESVSLLDELHFVHRNVEQAPPPAELLRMATLDAARALRLDERIGSLEAGKQADLAAFPCDPDVRDPLTELIDAPRAPRHVWVAGRMSNVE